MSSLRKLSLASVVLIAAVCAALPFQKHLFKQSSRRDAPRSQFRWRDTRASVPAPLRHEGADLANEELNDMDMTQPRAELEEPTNHVSHAVTLRDASQPPLISPVYQPLLMHSAKRGDHSPLELRGSEADLARPMSPNSLAITSNEKQPETGFKVIRHRIRDGDTLQALAARYLGDPNRYQEIYENNKQRLPSSEVLPLNLMIEIYVPR